MRKRKPTHPGEILEEDYILPLNLNLDKLAEHLNISRNTLYKIRVGESGVTASVALALAEAFDTTPQFWLNLQQNYDLWMEQSNHAHISPIVKGGRLLPKRRNLQIAAAFQ
jgi:addiction module HigA family antidote